MNKQERVHSEIEKTLASLDGAGRAEPDAFFYTRVKGRLESKTESAQWTFPLVWRIALGMLLLINTFTVFKLAQEDDVTDDPLTTLTTDYFDAQDDTYEINLTEDDSQ